MQALRSLIKDSRELTLILGVILILFVLFAPIPSFILDLALLMNFGLSLTILLLALHVAKPVDFSTFPSLLLISTLFRLALNVAATRLILTDGYAGEVISSIGSFAAGGNFIVGVVVFFILVVVQYVVVTSGAQRVSEVAARFTLDSMPGQQMSIDADLNMGLIDQKEAVRRRAALEKEASFYGAMDGASKFVKGDAIAGVIILLIDIIAGWIIGVAQMGMNWDEALQHFSLLTIGDGIATQLPALIISTATGIIVTRSSADRDLSTEVFQQLSSVPRVPIIVAGMLTLLLLLPGMPKWPIFLVVGASFFAWRGIRKRAKATEVIEADAAQAAQSAPASVAPLVIAFGPELAEAWAEQEALILDRIASLRAAHQQSLGVSIPAAQIKEDRRLGPLEYDIRIFGARYASAEIQPRKDLAIRGETSRYRLSGVETLDPAFGLPATWIEPDQSASARESGYSVVDPLTVFITHLGEVAKAEAATLLTRADTMALLDGVRARQPGLVEELVPTLLSVSDIQRVLQNLLAESVSISELDQIVEHLVDLARIEKDTNALGELLRQRLCHAICDSLRGRFRDLAVISFDPRLENQLRTGIASSVKKDLLALDPRLAEQVLRKLSAASNELMRAGRTPVLLCGGELRRPLRALTRRTMPRLAILSVAEIPMNIELRSHDIVRIEEEPSRRTTSATAPASSIGMPDGYQLQ
jgi:flagellar biosynthesis protein FlhA